MILYSRNFLTKWATLYIIHSCLIGCSTPYHPTAPISSVYDNSNTITNYPAINKKLSKSRSIRSFSKNTSINNKSSNINQQIYQSVIIKPDNNSNSRIIYNRNYSQIPKGSYRSKSYIVKRGDTLFYVAWITGNDYRNLAYHNKIIEPYSLKVGQLLNIDNSLINADRVIPHYLTKRDSASEASNTHTSSIDIKNSSKILPTTIKPLIGTKKHVMTESSGFSNNSVVNTLGKCLWPAKGKVIEYFSTMQGGNKGVDIAGFRGQPVFATASGKVVYSGNALRGYGNLIIIKHNDDYLSAYAHNDTILVHEQQEVHVGQKIATMGSTDTNSVRLHFEIRYKGKSVNPLRYISHR